MTERKNAERKTDWQRKKLKLKMQLIWLVRECSSRYIVWRLDRNKPITGCGLRFIERKLSSAMNQYCQAEQEKAKVRTYAANH